MDDMATGAWANPYAEETITVTLNTTNFSVESWGRITGNKIGNMVYIRANGVKPKVAASGQMDFLTISGFPPKVAMSAPFFFSNGSVAGRVTTVEGSNIILAGGYPADNEDRFLSLMFPVG